MALLSEAYFKHTDTDWSLEGVKGAVPIPILPCSLLLLASPDSFPPSPP